MYATTEGTTRYIDRFPRYRDAAFYRTILGLNISSLGIGTYLGVGGINHSRHRAGTGGNGPPRTCAGKRRRGARPRELNRALRIVHHVAPVTHEQYLRLYQ
jgi:hypothetical protein